MSTSQPPPRPIDLRSDTVTRPSEGMRRAMATAEVGDDVFGEDPTVARLQEVVADRVGTEAALFVPSGTMANQIAIKLHTRPGDEVIAGRGAHNWMFESGAASALSGVQMRQAGDDGRFSADDVRAAYSSGENHHFAPTRLVCVENTHNMSGGRVWDPEELARVVAVAAELGLATHLDGARLWNAAARTGRSERELAAGFDTVSVCLSKGLGAPVGSLLCGSRKLVHRAHRFRKMFGGGMRQVGVLAAAGLYALEHHRPELGVDHENAGHLARALAAIPGLEVDPERVDTNILMVDVPSAAAPAIASAAKERGLLFVAMAPTRFRLVTHRDVSREQCTRAAEILAAIVPGLTDRPA
jgi:threonine aldolase